MRSRSRLPKSVYLSCFIFYRVSIWDLKATGLLMGKILQLDDYDTLLY